MAVPGRRRGVTAVAAALGIVLGLGIGVATAREPAAFVVELALADGIPPPACRGVAFHDRALFIALGISQRLAEGGNAHLRPEIGLHALEDAGFIVMLRWPQGCRLYLARRTMPAVPAQKDLPEPVAATAWRVGDDDTLQVDHAGRHRTLAPGEGWCLLTAAEEMEACRLRLHYYGRLPLYQAEPPVRETAVEAGAAICPRFAGPGDGMRYRLALPQAGMLVVEYRSDAGPGSLDIAIRGADGALLGSGGAFIPGPMTVSVTLDYRGSGAAAADVGLLFTPDRPLACLLTLETKDDQTVAARLRLENRGEAPLRVTVPGPGSVRWYVGPTLVAAARPGRLPEERLLDPGAALIYDLSLALPDAQGALWAEVATGAAGTLACRPVAPVPENNCQ